MEKLKSSREVLVVLIALLVVSLFLLVPVVRGASDVSFKWDANTETDLAGYRIYQSTTSGQYTYGAVTAVGTIPAGTETVTVNVPDDGTYFWVMTAFDNGGNESGPSNEVTKLLDSPPASPKGFRNTIIKYITVLLHKFNFKGNRFTVRTVVKSALDG